jgi:DNA-binding transcriptional ArsR family regulator
MSSAPNIDDLTTFCKATSDHLRLLILRILARESFGVLELCHIIGSTQPALSHHLKILNSAGLVETRRQGTSIFYRRALVNTDDQIKRLKQCLIQTLDDLQLDHSINERKAEIHAERHDHAKSFFEKNADQLKENQNQIADFELYAECIGGLMTNENFKQTSTVIEVGPGESDLLLSLSRQFGHVIAVDNTEEMLNHTRRKTADHQLPNVEHFKGELRELGSDNRADLIVLNMVLHHLASPALFFTDAYEYLEQDGRLLIAELCPHDQDWAREVCGDLWLGFDPRELDDWATAANFTPGQSAYLGMKNGFQVQVRMFERNNVQFDPKTK